MLRRFARDVVSIEPSDSAVDAAERMKRLGVGCVVVVERGRPVGIVTDRDLVVRVVAEGRDAERTRVADVMTCAPVTLSISSGIEAALVTMRRGGVRRLPLVSDDGRLVGIVTSDDLYSLLGRELGSLAATLDDASDADELR